MSSGSSRSLILVSNWKEDTSLPKTRTLCAACGCHLLSAPPASELLHAWLTGPLATGSGGAGRRGGRCRGPEVGPEEGAWSGPARSAAASWPGTNQSRRGNSLALGRIMQITRLVSVFRNTQMLDYKSESCPGAINLCSLFDSGSSFCKHWRPGFHCQAPVRLSLAESLSQRAILLWDVGC